MVGTTKTQAETKKPCTAATMQGQNYWLVSRTPLLQEGVASCH